MSWSYVNLALSDREAEQLIAYLGDLLEGKGKKGEHWHLSEEPAYEIQ